VLFRSPLAFLGAVAGRSPVFGKGESTPFQSDFCEGTVCLVHKSSEDGKLVTPAELTAVLEVSGPPTACWEFQLQVRFKIVPKGPVFVGFELQDGPLQLGIFTRGIARAILSVGQSMARQRGADIRYTLGDEKEGERPHIAIPVTAFLRMFRSDGPVPLPIMHPDKNGTWHLSQGSWQPIERAADLFDTEHYFTLVFNTNYIDFYLWNFVSIPALGSLDLATLCGSQALHTLIYDDGEAGRDTAEAEDFQRRRAFLEMELLPPHARHEKDEDVALCAESVDRN